MNRSTGVNVNFDGNMKKKPKAHVDLNFFKNLNKLLKVCIPKLFGREMFSLGLLTSTMMFRTFLSVYMSEVTSQIVKAIVNNDLTEFLIYILVLAGLSVPGSFANSLLDYLNKKLAIYFRENLLQHFQKKILKDLCYYKMTNLDSRIKNPDQIISQDIDKFANTLSGLYMNFSKPLMDIILFSHKLSKNMGWGGPATMMLWYALSAVVMRIITPSFGKLAAVEQSKNHI